MKYLFTLSLAYVLYGSSPYPVDSLLKVNGTGLTKKIALLPIAAWQRVSYNAKLFDCQFFPSCSNFGSKAIIEHGFLKGGVIAADRINRCNPYAIKYHVDSNMPFKDNDGRLIDPVNQQPIISEKSPYIASLYSTILPGLGKVYAGRIMDGLFGFWAFYLTGSLAYHSNQNGKSIATPFLGAITAYVYFGEIYGAFRAIKYYQKKRNNFR